MAEKSTTGADKLSTRQAVLEEAWKCFADCDYNANQAQSRFLKLRQTILFLGFLATATAVIYSVIPDPPPESVFSFKKAMHYVVLIIPITVSILVAGAVKFDKGAAWVLLRGSAEAIKREIFRFRCQVELYSKSATKKISAESKLAKKLKNINQRLHKGAKQSTTVTPAPEDYDFTNAVAAGDDRFSALTPDNYIQWRLMDQYTYYRKKAKNLYRNYQTLQWSILVIGGLGTLLAAIGQEVWVAVTSTAAASLGAYVELRRLESDLASFNTAAGDLNNLRIWWNSLDDARKKQPEHFEQLVKNTENVIQTENSGWVTEMQEALTELYSGENAAQKGPADLQPGVAIEEIDPDIK